MDNSDIEAVLIKAICSIQEDSGREAVVVKPSTRPLKDIPDFDSLNCVEVTVDALEALKIKAKFNNVLARDDRALTVSEAAERLAECIAEQLP